MRAAKHAPRDPYRVLERRHGLADIIERGGVVVADVLSARLANNYACALLGLQRFEEAKSLLLKTIPIAQRVSGESGHITLTLKEVYAEALYKDDGATLGNLREALTTLEDIDRTARRVLASLHPRVRSIEECLESVRAALRARETPSPRE